MELSREIIINKTIEFVKKELSGAESGHDWLHTHRVWKLAKHIAEQEKVDLFIVELGALLHDIADSKFHNGNEEIGPNKAQEFLNTLALDVQIITHVEQIIRHISFKNSLEADTFQSPELAVVQDADRLDAIGAIGIARAFNYGGYMNRQLYNPDIQPALHLSKDAYKASQSPTLNHFFEKLLLLKDKMNTVSGKSIARHRHTYMEQFIKEFLDEWNGIT
jgi:uncharacterized protein